MPFEDEGDTKCIAYADLLSNADEVQSFRVNVLLEGLQEGDYTSDFVITKTDGGLMIRECVSRMKDDPVYVGLTYSNDDIDEFMNHAGIEHV